MSAHNWCFYKVGMNWRKSIFEKRTFTINQSFTFFFLKAQIDVHMSANYNFQNKIKISTNLLGTTWMFGQNRSSFLDYLPSNWLWQNANTSNEIISLCCTNENVFKLFASTLSKGALSENHHRTKMLVHFKCAYKPGSECYIYRHINHDHVKK